MQKKKMKKNTRERKRKKYNERNQKKKHSKKSRKSELCFREGKKYKNFQVRHTNLHEFFDRRSEVLITEAFC